MIRKYSNYFINIFLLPLLSVTLIGSVVQLGIIQQTLSPKKNIFFTLLIIGVIIAYIFKKKISLTFNVILENQGRYWTLFTIIFICLIIYQLNLIRALTGSMELDPAFIYKLIMHKPTVYSSYFSWYPNILLLLNIENGVYHLTGQPSQDAFLIILSFINLVLIDTGLIFIYFAVKKQLGQKIGFCVFVISILLFGITPYIAVPYSDIWSFWLGSAYALLLSDAYNNNSFCSLQNKPISVVLLGVITALFIKMKPSTAIVVIATFIVFTLIIIAKRKKVFHRNKLVRLLRVSMLFVIPFFITAGICNYYANNNGLVKIDRDGSASPLHFMAMGLHGDGQYWEKFNLKDQSLPSSQRKEYDLKIIKKDIRDFKSISNFGNFLIQKQQHNTALASWQRNTGAVSWSLSPKLKLNNGFQKFLRNVFTKNNYFFWNGYLIFVQFVWIASVIFAILAVSANGYIVQVMKYALVGGFVFLLLFEGGVSRYLIQFLPFMIILAGYGLKETVMSKERNY